MRSVMLRRPRRQNEPRYDPSMPEFFASNPRSFVPWELTASKPWPGKLHTRQINLHEKCFIPARANSKFVVFDSFLVTGLFLLVKRIFKMQVLTLMVINGLKHDVKFVNPRTKHHYWNIRSVNKLFLHKFSCWFQPNYLQKIKVLGLS